MKTIVFLFFLSQIAQAEAPVQEMISKVVQTQQVSSAGCPQAGYQVFRNVASSVGKAASSSSTILALMNQAQPKQQELQAASDHCGGVCKQVNSISPFTESGPAEVRTDLTCDHDFVRDFQADLNNDELQAFASDILRGRSADGAKLAADCPSNCNYYIASAHTPLNAETSRLNMSVHCGPPRQGSLLLAPYTYKVGFIQQWTCTKE